MLLIEAGLSETLGELQTAADGWMRNKNISYVLTVNLTRHADIELTKGKKGSRKQVPDLSMDIALWDSSVDSMQHPPPSTSFRDYSKEPQHFGIPVAML